MIARVPNLLRRRGLAVALLLITAPTALLAGCPSSAPAPPPAPVPAPSPTAAAVVGRAKIDAALEAAEKYIARNERDAARLILQELIVKAPGESHAHELLGQVLYIDALIARARGDEAAAAALSIASYDRYRAAVDGAAGRSAELRAGLHQSAGEIASAAGLRERALEHFEAAAKLSPLNAKHPLHAAQMDLLLGRVDAARSALERALLLDPDDPYAHASMALVALAGGDRAAAIASIEEARRIDPGDMGLRVQEARVRRLCDQPAAGLQLLSGLDARTRAEEGVTEELAACSRRLGDPAGAAEAWEHRYREHPEQWRAALRAAEAHLEAGQRDRAWALVREAAAAAPSAPEVIALQKALGD